MTTKLISTLGAAIVIGAIGLAQTATSQQTESDKAAEKAPAQSAQSQPQGTNQKTPPPAISLVDIAPGPAKPVNEQSAEARRIANDPEMIAAGRQLYDALNCVGCHFRAGGGMGPPLMDNEWIYGSSIEHIAASIREGRPAGMPTFREMLPEDQIWQVAAYVKSLSEPKETGAIELNGQWGGPLEE